MKGLNSVNLIGNLGQDPEMRFTPAGKSVLTFSLATSRKYKGGEDELVEETTWHRIVCWERLAETCNKALSKGDPVYLRGRIRNTSWEDEVGKKHYSSEIVAGDVIFLGKPRPGAEVPADAETEPVGAAVADDSSGMAPEDIPF